ncbi:PTS sugar transporter subunit IIA [Sporolactobacillus nakayamae]|uniref:PTS system, mannose-specific IIA component n=1 Tax=Sporolactobacillus nakayamae TaxID=269670 RepID=A0A1I2UXP3_9BACL|nr:PTS mannose/fructose/sorbose family IIA subunit [Sporolactobacillus nakayamae]SFG79686.1 PTS system, mannose-specific IIA component [Sporolactobacillus nakayamae]
MKILLTSHGEFCTGLLNSFHMVAGKSNNIYALALTDAGIRSFSNKLNELLNELTLDDQVLILCDMKGGTPFNESYKYYLSHKQLVNVVYGMNLPMVIETGMSLNSVQSLQQLGKIAVSSGIENVGEVLDESNELDELDF